MQHFAKLLGFRSPRAQDVIHRGIDHHRSRQILHCVSTLLNALAKELVRPFVMHQREAKNLIPINSLTGTMDMTSRTTTIALSGVSVSHISLLFCCIQRICVKTITSMYDGSKGCICPTLRPQSSVI